MEKIIENFVEQQKNLITKIFKDRKQLQPTLSLLTKKDDKNCVHVCPLPELTDDNKDIIRYVLLKAIKDKLKSDGHNLLCVNFSSECWQYIATKEELERVNGNYRKLPKQEILMLHFDTKDGNKTISYKIEREMSVNENGLNEDVEIKLEEIFESSSGNNMEGRFTDLFNS